ncbi:RNA polymerase sporulation sigma factor SigF [Hydrogenibacillus schlegelii]|uniref:RNA polymerase sigma factor n=1 Tax=Hydrogenibacillus schlegelii TaxID=1484 RepID=A0A132N596_HYDSH|nr:MULTISPECIES: RNA polymerase sporulation sigma factor SigF [Hydrogenibacillus]KWX05187.1 sporulation sigma factor SigF [Hydrogenibacillus schlegelii]MBE3563899.1 RNA polymerase sporulation sigma factor SigF [Hydrogenibacillus schlegelii]MBT9283329.1 RNA polymerase sporulation sigma factor SigF [Hydrogenibacillus schlegelii]OAR03205.1 RNA polymerase sigma-F factor [Hydrogenibacillus schlegelii]PTQ53698.1 MAG: RNA polymerase sporulation specific sigma factor SigF [Hydrogenibacillus schlegelii
MSFEAERAAPALSDEEIRSLIARAHAGDEAARTALVEANLRLVWSIVQRFLNRGYEADDLFQIGAIGLIKAIDKFDLAYDVKFSTYAVPMIIGEIQRFIRDDGTIKVSRALKEAGLRVRRARDELMKSLGREPTIQEVADALGLTPDDVILAQEATRPPASIHETVYENDGDPITLLDQIADDREEAWIEHVGLRDVIARLPERERLIIYLRFFKDQTQEEVAARLGISQVQVSRLEKKILETLKKEIGR